jgi:putative spermidine/putrescine transport system substrate-binding protein
LANGNWKETAVNASVNRAVLAGVIGFTFANAARAEVRTLRIEGVRAGFQQLFLTEVVPAFSAKYHVPAEYAGGNSTDQIARMVAGKGNPQTDVFITDDGPMYRAIELGLCGKVEGLPAADLIDLARYKNDRAVGFGLLTGGISYNTKYFAEHGWSPPTSWDDLNSPRFHGLLAFAPINNTWGVLGLVMIARSHGGSETNMEPGFAAMKDIARNVLAFDLMRSNEMFQTGQIVVAVSPSAMTKTLMDTGFPVDYVYPKEGAPAVLVSACPIARPDALPAAQTFIEYLLSPDVQLLMAEKLAHAPVNRRVELPASVSKTMPVGDNAGRVVTVDWATINEKRAEWDKRWTHEIER